MIYVVLNYGIAGNTAFASAGTQYFTDEQRADQRAKELNEFSDVYGKVEVVSLDRRVY
jgi:hypothetical protein